MGWWGVGAEIPGMRPTLASYSAPCASGRAGGGACGPQILHSRHLYCSPFGTKEAERSHIL